MPLGWRNIIVLLLNPLVIYDDRREICVDRGCDEFDLC